MLLEQGEDTEIPVSAALSQMGVYDNKQTPNKTPNRRIPLEK